MTVKFPHRKFTIGMVTVGLIVSAPHTPLVQASLLDKAKDALDTFGQSAPSMTQLTTGEIAGGLREALWVGTERVVQQLGQVDGFNADPAVHIPLPGTLQTVKSVLANIGMSGMADELETRLNRAAEAATPEAKQIFAQAITKMTLDDVMHIYNGPENAATQYFKRKMSPRLFERMTPIIASSLSDVGAVQTFDQMMAQYKNIPFVPDVKANLTGYVVEKSLDGLFYYVGKQEAAIRQNPTARTTELLRRVFGAN
jgi:hypothetical protein